MTATRSSSRAVLFVFAAALIALTALGFALSRIPGSSPAAPATASARAAAEQFLARYVRPSGRVVRSDQGGDTVSEGQAYALLAAVGAGDKRRFDAVWRWTRAHLQRQDGLLAWHWAGGHVLDRQPAADADADAARALALAARRFRQRAYARAANRIAGALADAETSGPHGRRVTVAGPWARTAPYTLNPSYFAPAGDAVLARGALRRRFKSISAAERTVLTQLTARGRMLAPDWAHMNAGGVALPAAPANGSVAVPQYSFDALRVPIRLAESCDRRDRALAARMWPLLRRGGNSGAVPRALDGRPLEGAFAHPAALVGAAASAAAAHNRTAARRLLGRAEALDRSRPGYYGAAWVALGRLMLTTRALGGCPPLSG